MTEKQFFDWQTSGGANDVLKLVEILEKADISWCAIGGIAVNHWAQHPLVTRDIDLVVVPEALERITGLLEETGFHSERFTWPVNFKGKSAISIQFSTENIYDDFPSRAVAADVHGILLRVASLEDTLKGKILAWSDPTRRQSKRLKDLADIARLVEAHVGLWEGLPDELKKNIQKPVMRDFH